MFKRLIELKRQKKLLKEFEDIKNFYIRNNYKLLMEQRLMPYVRTTYLEQYGYMPSEIDVIQKAHELFCMGKSEGKIDCLNSIKESEE